MFTHELARLSIELGVVVLVAVLAHRGARRMKLPPIVCEIIAGMLIGPYALGAVAVPGFPGGLFTPSEGPLPVSMALFAFAATAAVLHVFLAGLESDAAVYLRLSAARFWVAALSSAAAVAAGVLVAIRWLGLPLLSPATLLLASVSLSASVGMPARVLAARHRSTTPEGVAAIGAAVFHDGVAILLLSVALAVAEVGSGGGFGSLADAGVSGAPASAAALVGRAFLIWALALAAGLLGARPFGRLLKWIGPEPVAALSAFAIALILGGVFEVLGLASVVGGYVLGLALSRTDLVDVLHDHLHQLERLFVPLLYVVFGMLIDLRVVVSPGVLGAGLLFALISNGAKVVGAGLPARAFGFTRYGALCIATALIPRGEIGVIVATLGLSLGLLETELFKSIVVMIFASAILGTTLFDRVIAEGRRGSDFEPADAMRTTRFRFPTAELAELVGARVQRGLQAEGFFLHRREREYVSVQMRRETVFISMSQIDAELEFVTRPRDQELVHTVLKESLAELRDAVEAVREAAFTASGPVAGPAPGAARGQDDGAAAGTAGGEGGGEAAGADRPPAAREVFPPSDSAALLARYLDSACVIADLAAAEKEEAICRLLDCLVASGKVRDPDLARRDLLARERALSTGLSDGVALPHAKTAAVDRICCAVGIARGGIAFGSPDGKPARILLLVLSPRGNPGPHLQLLAALSTALGTARRREAVLAAASPEEIIAALRSGG